MTQCFLFGGCNATWFQMYLSYFVVMAGILLVLGVGLWFYKWFNYKKECRK